MIRTHIRIAHIASIRTGSPVDSRQCDWGIRNFLIHISCPPLMVLKMGVRLPYLQIIR